MKLLFAINQSTKLLKKLRNQNVFLLRKLSSSNEPVSRIADIFHSGKLPETFNFATDVFDVHSDQTPSKTALWIENGFQERKWSFSQLRTESIRTAISLKEVTKNCKHTSENPYSTIFSLLPRVPEWWFVYMASIRLGYVFCPATIMLSPEDIAYRLKTCEAKIVITNEANMWKIEKAQTLEKFPTPIKIVVPEKKNSGISAEGWIQYDELTEDVLDADILAFINSTTKSDALCQIFFTSGTTGKPKMVAHSHTSYGLGHYSTCKALGIKDTDVFWNLSDPGWAKSSYGSFFGPWMVGATVYINQMERFEIKSVMDKLCKKPITGFCAAPTFFRSMVQEDASMFQFKSLRFSIGGGEALNPEVVQAWKNKTGLPLDNLYGQTETTTLTHGGEEWKENSIGKGFPESYIRIVDESGNELPTGTEGIIAIKVKPYRPIGVFKGYIKDGSKTFEIDENHKSVVGDYYLTGDLAYMDKDGYIFYVGRTDDVIISAGYRIGPFEVESVLQAHPAIAENAVVASPDSHRGSVVKAFIVLTEKYRNSDKLELTKNIQDYFKKNGAPYKYPRKIEFVESLPKTVSGKILRRDLRDQEFSKRH